MRAGRSTLLAGEEKGRGKGGASCCSRHLWQEVTSSVPSHLGSNPGFLEAGHRWGGQWKQGWSAALGSLLPLPTSSTVPQFCVLNWRRKGLYDWKCVPCLPMRRCSLVSCSGPLHEHDCSSPDEVLSLTQGVALSQTLLRTLMWMIHCKMLFNDSAKSKREVEKTEKNGGCQQV